MHKANIYMSVHLQKNESHEVELKKLEDGSELLIINDIDIFGIELIKEQLIKELTKGDE